MSTKREWGQYDGVLRGNGVESRCKVKAEKVSTLGLPPIVCNCDVVWVEHLLPNGPYKLYFEGTVRHVRNVDGEWLGEF